MKAAYYSSFKGPISIENLPDPAPPENGVVLRVLATGLCLSDWHGWKGHDKDIHLPHVPGHELVGKIVEVGSAVKDWQIGQRVTLPFVCGCGSCPTCHEGNPQVCPDQFQPGFTHWGSFAEYVAIHYADANLVPLPDEIENETAASLGCRFATSFRGLVDQAKVQPEETVAIFGCGGVGLSAIMIAKARGAFVIAIDMKQTALDKAKTLGADHCILSNGQNLGEEIVEYTRGGAHITVDAIGHEKVLRDATLSLKRRGRHIQIGLLSSEVVSTVIPMERVIAYELSIHGSHGMQANRYPEMINMILNKKLNPDRLIDKMIDLEEGAHALPHMENYEGSGIRVINSF